MYLRLGGWFDGQATKEAVRDRMRPFERIDQMAGVMISLLIAVYFIVLFNSNSGFFLSKFSTMEAILFFGLAIFGVAPGLMKAITGRKNSSRPLDIILSVSVLVVAVWFLSTFPFDFSHLPDSLPASLSFLMSWLSDGLARAFMILAIITSVFIIPYTTMLYIKVRQKLSSSGTEKEERER